MTQETREALSKLLKSKDPQTRYDAVELIVDLYDKKFDEELTEVLIKEEVPILKSMILAILGHRKKSEEE